MIILSPQMQEWWDRLRREEARYTARERRRMAYVEQASKQADALLDRIATASHA